MLTSDFDYHLPEELIAQFPPERRDASKMMVLDRITGKREIRGFADLPEYLCDGDCVVVNNTKVTRARFFGLKAETGAKIEILLTMPLDDGASTWQSFLKPGKRVREGTRIELIPNDTGKECSAGFQPARGEKGDGNGEKLKSGAKLHSSISPSVHQSMRRAGEVAGGGNTPEKGSKRDACVTLENGNRDGRITLENGKRDACPTLGDGNRDACPTFGDSNRDGRITFGDGKRDAYPTVVVDSVNGDGTFNISFDPALTDSIEHEYGHTPLPPYIKRSDETSDADRYQTVFAKEAGAVAAPTAGLHFTEDILAKLAAKGVEKAEVTLHVGPGTFRPVSVENPDDHKMHSERFTLTRENAEKINKAHENGGRVFAVGTTSVRVLETCADQNGMVRSMSGTTDIFLRPPARPKVTDMLLTNFHLPKSTLLMLVATFADREDVLAAYEAAKLADFRFFSYGDCMLLK